MKLKQFADWGSYQSPSIMEIDVTSEGILCESGDMGGSTAESYNRVEDLDGWGI